MRKWTGPPARAVVPGRAVAVVAAAAAAALALAGCDSPGTLHDAGPARQVAEHPSPQPLWPAAATSAPAAGHSGCGL
ncbi:protein phosphatase, partial [Kitasatospora sp. DSM 101779]|nr:protein phosphatase [Kitasatospora sp. DSM 101779]